MSIFTEAENKSAYLKAGLLGFAGAGKTRTATEIAVGLHKLLKQDKPVYFIDTETGLDYVLPNFKKEGIKVYGSKSRAFVDLLAAVDEAEKDNAILVIDSITHFWTELMDAFKKRFNTQRLLIHHWGMIKPEWRKFTDRYINSQCHIIMCGRAGWDFDREKDEDGVMELVKTGTKMKAEAEIGFEPSLLVEMERVRNEKGKVGGSYTRRAWVIKERFGVIDGKHFDNPTFECFLPHINLLNIGGEHVGVDVSNSSEETFSNDNSWYHNKKEKDIVMEEINDQLTLMYSTSAQDKKDRINTLKEIFNSSSKTAIEGLDIIPLREGLTKLKELQKERESK